jgi:FkbM family methyltransferase
MYDATVLDIGANIGLSAITLARLAKKVIAFEPSPPNAMFLRKNLNHNGISNVELVDAAASNQADILQFHVAQFGAGSHVVSGGDLSRGAPTINVPAKCLDEIELPPISFIKIDVEGHEPEVFAGARRLLARDRPLIFMEINIWCLTAYADHNLGDPPRFWHLKLPDFCANQACG